MTARYALSGVPLAQLRFARALAGKGHEVEYLIGLVNAGSQAPVVPRVNVIDFGKARVLHLLFPLVRYFRQKKPDVVFTAGDHLNAVVLTAAMLSGSKAKISCSSRVTPFDTFSNQLFSKRWIHKWVMRLVMRRADALTCVSRDMVDQFRQVFPNSSHRCVYNIVDDAVSRQRMLEDVEEPWLADGGIHVIVAAGALEPWKGFGDLIRALSLIPIDLRPRLLLGDGPLRRELLSLVDQVGLQSCVKLVGYVENPLKYFRNASAFVLPSHVEGLPNVLVEAMMCGCTPVATNCPTGPTEVLQGGRFGYLVPVGDTAAMANAIAKALKSPIAAHDLEEAVAPFSETKVLQQHFRILGYSGEH